MLNLQKALELTIAARDNIGKNLELEELIKQALREQMATEKGGNAEKKRLKAVEKYIKKTIKDINHQKKMHGVWEIEGKQYFSNSHSGYELTNKIEGLPTVEGFPSLKEIFKNHENKFRIKRDMPDLVELKLQYKEAIAEEKARGISVPNKRYFKLGESWFNIELFVEIFNIITGDIKIYGGENALDGLLVTNGEDNAILLPIRMKEQEEQKTA